MTVQERSALATRTLCQALGLGTLKPADLKFLALALTEIASAEIKDRAGFGERVSAAFEQVRANYSAKGKGATSKGKSTGAGMKPLVPIGNVDPARFAPSARTDPYALLDLYGSQQLEAALSRYPASELKKAAALVEERNPGTKPPARASKPALIEYIVRYVGGGRR
jgi:hypothetical protein